MSYNMTIVKLHVLQHDHWEHRISYCRTEVLANEAFSGMPHQVSLHPLNVSWVESPPWTLQSELPPKSEKACPEGSPCILQIPDPLGPFFLISEM